MLSPWIAQFANLVFLLKLARFSFDQKIIDLLLILDLEPMYKLFLKTRLALIYRRDFAIIGRNLFIIILRHQNSHDVPEDFVIATGRMETIRKFIELTAKELNWGSIIWEGTGVNEIGRREDTNAIVIRIDEKYFRPTEVSTLLGDPTLANKELGWVSKTTLEELVAEMVKVDKEEAQKELLLVKSGFDINSINEQPPNL